MCIECVKMIKCMKSKAKVPKEPCTCCGKLSRHLKSCWLSIRLQQERNFRELQVQEACAQFLLAIASIRGSRTKTGKLLCDIAEDIRNGRWKAHTIYEEEQ